MMFTAGAKTRFIPNQTATKLQHKKNQKKLNFCNIRFHFTCKGNQPCAQLHKCAAEDKNISLQLNTLETM